MRILKLIIKKYPWAVMAPIIGGIVLAGTAMAYTIYQASRYTPPTTSAKGEENKNMPGTRPQFDHYAVIFQRDLFAPALSGVEEQEEKRGATPAATVPFKLRGTMVVTPGVSFAIIEDPATKKQELYRQDQEVNGFKIVKILRNKVIVDKDGREEVVEIIEEEKPSATPGGEPVQGPRTIKRRPLQVPVKKPPPTSKAPVEFM